MNKSVNKRIFIQAGLTASLLSVHCITGVGDDYWNDYYRKKNLEPKKYNNPTGGHICSPLQICMNKCYEGRTGGGGRGAVAAKDSSYTVYIRNCEKDCRNTIFCDSNSDSPNYH